MKKRITLLLLLALRFGFKTNKTLEYLNRDNDFMTEWRKAIHDLDHNRVYH